MIKADLVLAAIHESIEQARSCASEDDKVTPKVGAVLTNLAGEIVASAFRNERGHGDHAEFIVLSKAAELGINPKDCVLFTTLEPCVVRSPEKTPCLNRILDSGVTEVHIGMLDPNPGIRGIGEIQLRSRLKVERYPGDIVKQLEELNSDFMALHRESLLPETSVFVRKQIPDYVADHLREAGASITKLPGDWGVSADDLQRYCDFSKIPDADFEELLVQARGAAYDAKYSDYTYDQDARGLNSLWTQEIADVFDRVRQDDFRSAKVLVVGSGNGLETAALFPETADVTLVDIAPRSLTLAARANPWASTQVAAAENLSMFPSNSFDIYISLRTYQSTYFGVARAVREACRVVRADGLVLVSVSNGFLGKDNALIPGLVIPGTNVVDRNRSFEVVDQIRRGMTKLPFAEIGVYSGFAEVFVFGRKRRGE